MDLYTEYLHTHTYFMVFLTELNSLGLGFGFLVKNMITYLCMPLSLSFTLSVRPSVWLSSPSVRQSPR